jgi:hypothetical protein
MKHPALALLWHCWRLSRRWYCVMLAITLGVHFMLLNLRLPGMESVANLQELQATGVTIVTMLLAAFTTLIATSLGGSSGFPFRFEHRLPVSTATLVGVPMATLAALHASLFVIPVLLSRLMYGIPLPVLAGGAIISTMAVLLVAASWSTATVSMRSMALVCAAVGGSTLMRTMQPFHINESAGIGTQEFAPDFIALSGSQYLWLALVLSGLYAITVYCVGMQRQGERWRLLSVTREGSERKRKTFNEVFTDYTGNALRMPARVSSPWQAELWLELKRHGMPVLAMGLLFALVTPMFPQLSELIQFPNPALLAMSGPVAVFFYGMGTAVFNRRSATGGYMSAFEGTRRLGTLQMAGVQLGTLGISIGLAIALIMISFRLSAPLYGDVGPPWAWAADLLDYASALAPLQKLSIAVVTLVAYFGIIAFYFCLHSCSTFWGGKALFGTLVFLIVAAVFARIALSGEGGDFVAMSMWWIAGVTLALTVLLVARAFSLKLMSATGAVVSLLVWTIALACAYTMYEGLDLHFPSLAPELMALNAALWTLPLTLLLGTAWCYDRLRHR